MDEDAVTNLARDVLRSGRVQLGRIGPGRYRVWLDRRLIGTVVRERGGWACRDAGDHVLARSRPKRDAAARVVLRAAIANAGAEVEHGRA